MGVCIRSLIVYSYSISVSKDSWNSRNAVTAAVKS